MCGIVGVVGEGSGDPGLLARMAGLIAHRGPDDQGAWIDEQAKIGFGHRRLSIVDLSPYRHQPMQSADGHYVLL